MSRYFLIFFSFYSISFSSQVFEFDYTLTYQHSKIKPNPEDLGKYYLFLNSSKRDYTMFSINSPKMKSNWIKDILAKIYYKFIVVQRDELPDLYYYDYARKFLREDKKIKNSMDRVQIKKDSDNFYTVKIFNNKRKPDWEINIELQKSEKDLIYFDLDDLPEFIESEVNQELRSFLKDQNYVVKSVVSKYHNGYSFRRELLEVKKNHEKNYITK